MAVWINCLCSLPVYFSLKCLIYCQNKCLRYFYYPIVNVSYCKFLYVVFVALVSLWYHLHWNVWRHESGALDIGSLFKMCLVMRSEYKLIHHGLWYYSQFCSGIFWQVSTQCFVDVLNKFRQTILNVFVCALMVYLLCCFWVTIAMYCLLLYLTADFVHQVW